MKTFLVIQIVQYVIFILALCQLIVHPCEWNFTSKADIIVQSWSSALLRYHCFNYCASDFSWKHVYVLCSTCCSIGTSESILAMRCELIEAVSTMLLFQQFGDIPVDFVSGSLVCQSRE